MLYGSEAGGIADLLGPHDSVGELSFERNGGSVVIPDARFQGDNVCDPTQNSSLIRLDIHLDDLFPFIATKRGTT